MAGGILVKKIQHQSDQQNIDRRIGKRPGWRGMQLEQFAEHAVQSRVVGKAVIKPGRKQQRVHERGRAYTIILDYDVGKHRRIEVDMDKGAVG